MTAPVSMTFPEFARYMRTHPDRNAPTMTSKRIPRDGAESTGGIKTYVEALDTLTTGWPDGMAMVRSLALPTVRQMAPSIAAAPSWSYDVTGAQYDVGEYLSGVPECWQTLNEPQTKPAVSIILDSFIIWGIDNEALKLRGAGVVALTMALQMAGYAVEVSVTQGYRAATDNNRLHWCRVILTDPAGGPLDTDRLVFMLAHPGAKRWLLQKYGMLTAGLSRAQMAEESFVRHRSECPWAATLLIPGMQDGGAPFDTREGAVRWVHETFARITGQAQ